MRCRFDSRTKLCQALLGNQHRLLGCFSLGDSFGKLGFQSGAPWRKLIGFGSKLASLSSNNIHVLMRPLYIATALCGFHSLGGVLRFQSSQLSI
jgi:hypothetical protein